MVQAVPWRGANLAGSVGRHPSWKLPVSALVMAVVSLVHAAAGGGPVVGPDEWIAVVAESRVGSLDNAVHRAVIHDEMNFRTPTIAVCDDVLCVICPVVAGSEA